jgi:hypothetical protein
MPCRSPMATLLDCLRIFSPASSNAEGYARGRLVGVAVDRTGAVLVADDVGNMIWRVTPATAVSAALQP